MGAETQLSKQHRVAMTDGDVALKKAIFDIAYDINKLVHGKPDMAVVYACLSIVACIIGTRASTLQDAKDLVKDAAADMGLRVEDEWHSRKAH